jgi:hypothetical protein
MPLPTPPERASIRRDDDSTLSIYGVDIFHIAGGLIHVLLVLARIILIFNLIAATQHSLMTAEIWDPCDPSPGSTICHCKPVIPSPTVDATDWTQHQQA